MNTRIDISSTLIHFTKGIDYEDAANNLMSIIKDKTIFGNNNLIKGGDKCVCFSEAPLECLSNGLVNNENFSKYSPFGIGGRKDWLFRIGGRPVIYQTDMEFGLLPPELQWRHMTYNTFAHPIVDFTWEREWRIKTKNLEINPSDNFVIVPNQKWADIWFHYMIISRILKSNNMN